MLTIQLPKACNGYLSNVKNNIKKYKQSVNINNLLRVKMTFIVNSYEH